jgi:hypothetical protein
MITSPQQPLGDHVNIQGNEILIIVPNCNLQESRKEGIE